MADDTTITAGADAAARSFKAYFQLLADLANASSASYQVYVDQVTPDNIFRLDTRNGVLSAAANSLSKAGDMVPKAYQRYWNAL